MQCSTLHNLCFHIEVFQTISLLNNCSCNLETNQIHVVLWMELHRVNVRETLTVIWWPLQHQMEHFLHFVVSNWKWDLSAYISKRSLMYLFRSGFYTPSQQPLTLNCSLQIILYSESQSQTSPVNALTNTDIVLIRRNLVNLKYRYMFTL